MHAVSITPEPVSEVPQWQVVADDAEVVRDVARVYAPEGLLHRFVAGVYNDRLPV